MYSRLEDRSPVDYRHWKDRGWLEPDPVKSSYKLIVDFGLARLETATAIFPFSSGRPWCI